MSRKYSILGSFGFAVAGIKEAIKNEPNFRLHILITAIGLAGALYFKFSPTEWMILVLTVAVVLILELINTSIEAVVDLTSPGRSRLAKIAKDVAAAAVLISSVGAVVVGVILFGPRIYALLGAN